MADARSMRMLMLAMALGGAARANAMDAPAASFEYGSGAKVALVRVALQSATQLRWLPHNGKHVGLRLDLSLAQWRMQAYQNLPGRRLELTDIGLTPVLRYQADDERGWYGEGAIGIHLLSRRYDNDQTYLSTHGQFGDHLAVGYVSRKGWDASIKLQHFSNGGIKQPNSGVNFAVVRLAFALP